MDLSNFKSVWELMYSTVIENNWVMILENLTDLFRKDSFKNIVGQKNYYPQTTIKCRYYIKPNDGSCGKGIEISNTFISKEGYTTTPEIICPMIEIDSIKYKYDYRVWISIREDLTYFICPTFIQRVSMLPFDKDKIDGSLTNISLYSKIIEYQNNELYNKVEFIVGDVLKSLQKKESNKLMLTGWDFIENQDGELFVLEVNCNPGLNPQYTQVMEEFISNI